MIMFHCFLLAYLPALKAYAWKLSAHNVFLGSAVGFCAVLAVFKCWGLFQVGKVQVKSTANA